MLKVLTAVGVLLLAVPATAAEIECGGDGAGHVEGADEPVWVSVDDAVHIIDPDADADAPDSVQSFCEQHRNMIAIVIPAPKPGPDDEAFGGRADPEGDDFFVTEGEMADARRGGLLIGEAPLDLLDDGAGSGDAGEDGSSETSPWVPEVRRGALADSGDGAPKGCAATPSDRTDGGWWAFALVAALALCRRGHR